MRLRRDGKSHGTVVDWAKDFMQVGGIRAVEEEEKSPVLVLPSPVQLDQEPVRLSTPNEVIVETDTLTRHESMHCGIDSLTQHSPEENSHTRFHCRQELR